MQRQSTNPQYAVEDRGYTSPCWIWQWSNDRLGYGVVKDGGRNRKAHIVFWERANGPMPKGLVLDHLCEQKACVNPEHLEPVTHTENIRRCKHTKLNEAAVREIRSLRGVVPGAELARRFGVTRSAIYRVQVGDNWPDANHPRPPLLHEGGTKLSDDEVREIRRLKGVVPIVELSQRFGVGWGYISRIQLRKARKDVA